jgi:hypothetical protein
VEPRARPVTRPLERVGEHDRLAGEHERLEEAPLGEAHASQRLQGVQLARVTPPVEHREGLAGQALGRRQVVAFAGEACERRASQRAQDGVGRARRRLVAQSLGVRVGPRLGEEPPAERLGVEAGGSRRRRGGSVHVGRR